MSKGKKITKMFLTSSIAIAMVVGNSPAVHASGGGISPICTECKADVLTVGEITIRREEEKSAPWLQNGVKKLKSIVSSVQTCISKEKKRYEFLEKKDGKLGISYATKDVRDDYVVLDQSGFACGRDSITLEIEDESIVTVTDQKSGDYMVPTLYGASRGCVYNFRGKRKGTTRIIFRYRSGKKVFYKGQVDHTGKLSCVYEKTE